MYKAVMISIQPYYVFLIIALKMGWDIPQDKKVEVRKDFPKNKCWNKKVHTYCSKSKKSFNRIPKEYQPLMRPVLGKVIGEFVCDKINEFKVFENGAVQYWGYYDLEKSCLTYNQIAEYIGYDNIGYAWQISQLKIYDKPKELKDFRISRQCKEKDCEKCSRMRGKYCCDKRLNRPFQNWGYVEEM